MFQTFVNVFLDVLRRIGFIERKFAASGPAAIFWRNFCGGVKCLGPSAACRGSGIGAQNFSEQLFAVPVTIGKRGVEKIAAKIDGALQRAERFGVFGAGPSGHAPHSVTNFADIPSGAAKAAVVHGVLS